MSSPFIEQTVCEHFYNMCIHINADHMCTYIYTYTHDMSICASVFIYVYIKIHMLVCMLVSLSVSASLSVSVCLYGQRLEVRDSSIELSCRELDLMNLLYRFTVSLL